MKIGKTRKYHIGMLVLVIIVLILALIINSTQKQTISKTIEIAKAMNSRVIEENEKIDNNIDKKDLVDEVFLRNLDKGKYVNENMSNIANYSAINKSEEWEIEWVDQIGGSYTDRITSVAATADGGYIAGGYFKETITLSDGETLTSKGDYDGLIIKYNREGQIEWTEQIGGSNWDKITSVAGTADGGYIAGGYFRDTITLSNGETLTSKGDYDGLIIKYNREGQIEWTEQIGGSGADEITSVAATADGGYIVGLNFSSYIITLSNGETLTRKGYTDGLIIKYNREGQIEWTDTIRGEDSVEISSVKETTDKGYIVGGKFSGTTLSNGETLTSSYLDELIIKYNKEGEIEWTEQIEGGEWLYNLVIDEIYEGGYIIGKVFTEWKSITLSNGEKLTSKGTFDGLIIKYNREGQIEWTEQIGGSSNDQITSVVATADGGYIAGGYFSDSITLSNGETLTSKGSGDGLIIKYNKEGQIEWIEQIGGSSYDEITSIAETADGGYIAGGYFGSNITLSNGDTSKGGAVIIKYNKVSKPEIELDTKISKKAGTNSISVDDNIDYTLEYEATIRNFQGKLKLKITDRLPLPIDTEKSDFGGGQYDEATNTITWEEEIDSIDTFKEDDETKVINITQKFTVKYEYTEESEEKIENEAIAYTQLIEKTQGYIENVVEEQETSGSTEIHIYIPAQVITHHYLYDEETNTYTTKELAPEEVQNGIIGQTYTTKKSEQIGNNYTCINERPENYSGKMDTSLTEVKYYYKLNPETIQNNITKTGEVEDGSQVLKEENGKVTYNINYETTIEDYIGKAHIKIEDVLPDQIDEEKSDLAGGTYCEEADGTYKIVWEEEINNIDTYKDGTYTYETEKQIKIVYKNQDKAKDLINTAKGSTITYYPDNYPEKAGEPKNEITKEATSKIEQIEEIGKIIVKYIDEQGKELAKTETIQGKIGENYKTTEKQIEEYELIEVPENANGIIKNETQEVIYVYKKKDTMEEDKPKGTVIVKYIEKETNNEIAQQTVITGQVEEKYETVAKQIEGYNLIKPEPANKTGIIKEKTQEVIYYYEKLISGIITVKYIDKDTGKEITYKEAEEEKTYEYKITGKVGEKYKTEEKQIPYYTYLQNLKPVNSEGRLSQKDETVIYYYQKMPFNMKIEKEITKITINGEEQNIGKGKIKKIDIKDKEINKTNLQITYTIKITNTEQIAGSATILENIPKGLQIAKNNTHNWKQTTEGKLQTTTKELAPQETQEIQITLEWQNKDTNLGEHKNTAYIIKTNNKADYEETTKQDNTSEATLLISIKTGKEAKLIVIIISYIVAIGSFILLYEYELYQKERKRAVRIVKLEGQNVVVRKEIQK